MSTSDLSEAQLYQVKPLENGLLRLVYTGKDVVSAASVLASCGADIRDVSEFRGDLHVGSHSKDEWSNLRLVDGNVRIWGGYFPQLIRVTGGATIQPEFNNTKPAPQLEMVDDNLVINGNVRLPNLVAVGGMVSVSTFISKRGLDLSSLRYVGWIISASLDPRTDVPGFCRVNMGREATIAAGLNWIAQQNALNDAVAQAAALVDQAQADSESEPESYEAYGLRL